MKHYIGIDPGQRGFLTVVSPEGECVNSLAIEDSTEQDIVRFLSGWGEAGAVAAMEDVHSMPGQGVATTFAFGRNVGFLIGVLVALQIPYTLVSPQVWQREVWIASDKVYTTKDGKKKVQPKATSINAATRLFPTVDLRKSERSKTPHDGKCDSLLIATYAKRKNL